MINITGCVDRLVPVCADCDAKKLKPVSTFAAKVVTGRSGPQVVLGEDAAPGFGVNAAVFSSLTQSVRSSCGSIVLFVEAD